VISSIIKKILLLQCRNFGDALIGTGLLNSLGKSFSEYKIDVFTRPQFREIFYYNPFVNNIYYADFPVGTQKKFTLSTGMDFMKELIRLRKSKYSMCINNTGDFRENIIGWLIKPEENIAPLWEETHPFTNLVRVGGLSYLDKSVKISKSIINIYEINEYIAVSLGCNVLEKPGIYIKDSIPRDERRIGIHPTASMKCKLWPWENWKFLILGLRELKFQVLIFASPHERKFLEEIFKDLLDNKNVLIQSGTLQEFFLNLSSLKLLIGLDSFSIHAAYAMNIPSIMLNGGNDYRIWKTPGTYVLSGGDRCDFYPCYNKPVCRGKDFEYVCIRSIDVEDVLKRVRGEK